MGKWWVVCFFFFFNSTVAAWTRDSPLSSAADRSSASCRRAEASPPPGTPTATGRRWPYGRLSASAPNAGVLHLCVCRGDTSIGGVQKINEKFNYIFRSCSEVLVWFPKTRFILIKLETLGEILVIIKFVFFSLRPGSLSLLVPLCDQQGGAGTGELQMWNTELISNRNSESKNKTKTHQTDILTRLKPDPPSRCITATHLINSEVTKRFWLNYSLCPTINYVLRHFNCCPPTYSSWVFFSVFVVFLSSQLTFWAKHIHTPFVSVLLPF